MRTFKFGINIYNNLKELSKKKLLLEGIKMCEEKSIIRERLK